MDKVPFEIHLDIEQLLAETPIIGIYEWESHHYVDVSQVMAVSRMRIYTIGDYRYIFEKEFTNSVDMRYKGRCLVERVKE